MDKFNQRSIIDLSLLWEQYERIIKDDGAIVLFASQPFTTTLIQSNMKLYKYSWVWQKNKGANHVAIQFQPLKIHEDILVFSKAGVNTGASIPIKYHPQGVIWKEEVKQRKTDIKKQGSFRYNSLKAGEYKVKGTNYPKSILEFPLESKRYHPTQKPIDLCQYLIRTYTNDDPSEIVLDNCIGGGSTALASERSGRAWIGFEINESYVEITNERLQEERKNKSSLKTP